MQASEASAIGITSGVLTLAIPFVFYFLVIRTIEPSNLTACAARVAAWPAVALSLILGGPLARALHGHTSHDSPGFGEAFLVWMVLSVICGAIAFGIGLAMAKKKFPDSPAAPPPAAVAPPASMPGRMNKAQRMLVLAGIVSLAVGLHMWHYEYQGGFHRGYLSRERGDSILWWTWGYDDQDPRACTNRWDISIMHPSYQYDEALLGGVIAPIAVLGFGVFLFLGWREKNTTPRSNE